MLVVKPRQVHAARLVKRTQGLTVKPGEWRVLHSDDRIEVMSDEEISLIFDLAVADREGRVVPSQGSATAQPAPSVPVVRQKTKRVQRIKKRSLRIEVGNKTLAVGAQLVRCLAAIAKASGTAGECNASSPLISLSEADRISFASRVADAESRGFLAVERRDSPTGGRSTTSRVHINYCLTNEGLFLVNKLGAEAALYGEGG